MVKLCIVPPFPEEAVSWFNDFEGVECVRNDPADAEIIMGQPSVQTILSAPKLKWVQSTSAGVDGYAKHAEKLKHIMLTSASGAFGISISEWTLALVLSLYKHLNLFRDNQLARIWHDEGAQQSPRGKRLLTLGCGDIASSVARLFKAFGCTAAGIRRNASAEKPDVYDEVYPMSALESELEKADIVACALPSTPETRGLLNERRLSRMKPGAVLVNVGRGDLIDQYALCRLLDAGKICGAALDVTDPEPLDASHPLWQCKNCIITPHASGGSFGHLPVTTEIIVDICRENLARYLRGEPLKNRVDLKAGYRELEDRYGAAPKQ